MEEHPAAARGHVDIVQPPADAYPGFIEVGIGGRKDPAPHEDAGKRPEEGGEGSAGAYDEALAVNDNEFLIHVLTKF